MEMVKALSLFPRLHVITEGFFSPEIKFQTLDYMSILMVGLYSSLFANIFIIWSKLKGPFHLFLSKIVRISPFMKQFLWDPQVQCSLRSFFSEHILFNQFVWLNMIAKYGINLTGFSVSEGKIRGDILRNLSIIYSLSGHIKISIIKSLL